MPTNPTPFTPLSTPPSTSDPATFDIRADTFLGELPTFQTQANNWGTVTYNNAVESATNATQALASANSAATSAGAPIWVSGNTYTLNTIVRSPASLQIFYVKVASTSGSVDPSIDSTNWNPVPFVVDSLNGGQLAGNRNKIVNGDMLFSQRYGTSSTQVVGYTLDCWKLGSTLSNKLTVQQGGGVQGFGAVLTVTTTTSSSVAAGDKLQISQPLEADSITNLQLGTASAKNIAVSFLVNCTVAGTYSFALQNAAGTRSYVTTYTVSAGYNYISLSIPGDTAGTWVTTGAAASLVPVWDMGTGSTGTAPSLNQWLTGNYIHASGSVNHVTNSGAVWILTGAQLEQGTVATPFENASLTNKALNCFRYFQAAGGVDNLLWSGNSTSGVGYFATVKFFTPMRATPTVVGTNSAVNGFPATVGTISANRFGIQESRTSNATTSGASFSTSWTADASL